MIARNPTTTLSSKSNSQSTDDGTIEGLISKTSSGNERPHYDDEAPQIDNLDAYEHVDLQTLLPDVQIRAKQKNTNDTSIEPTISSTVEVPSVLDCRRLGMKRVREEDSILDDIEQKTGKHMFRPTKKTETEPTDQKQKQIEKKQKQKQAQKQKSMLTFNEDEI
jgi:hypothetical protein